MKESWSLRIDDDAIAWLVFDLSGAPVNVLSGAALRELSKRLREIAASRPVGVAILSGKPDGFIAGADINEFTAISSPQQGFAMVSEGQAVLQQIEDLPCPSVAVIHGFALGGGLELGLACRYRIGTDDAKLSLGLPEVQLGIHPGFGGTVRSVRLLGVRTAMEMMLTGKPLRAARALAVGLLDELAPRAELSARAKALILRAPPPRRASFASRLLNSPPARPWIARQTVAALRRKVAADHYPAPYAIVDLWRRYGAKDALSYQAEARSIANLICSPTSRNLVRVFQLQNRLKALGGTTARTFQRVHVIGAGVMGGDIATWCALRGLKVTLQDRSEELIRPALQRAKLYLDKRLKDRGAADAAFANLIMDPKGEGVASADVVIEAIVEKAEAKQALYAHIEPLLKPAALFATNTSSIRIETLCSALREPRRLIGIHFFNPVAQMQLVEVVRGRSSDPTAVHGALQFVRKLDKLPLPCSSSPGFVVNRILMPYINEGLCALEEGISATAIDQAGQRFGMPLGPLELADVIGLDVALNVGQVLAQAFGRQVPAVLARMVDQGKLGRKTSEGFYKWKDGKPLKGAAYGPSVVPANLEDRLILPMLDEAAACLREGVVEDADLLDAGVIFGTGFPPFRGGPLQYAKDLAAYGRIPE